MRPDKANGCSQTSRTLDQGTFTKYHHRHWPLLQLYQPIVCFSMGLGLSSRWISRRLLSIYLPLRNKNVFLWNRPSLKLMSLCFRWLGLSIMNWQPQKYCNRTSTVVSPSNSHSRRHSAFPIIMWWSVAQKSCHPRSCWLTTATAG